MFADDNKSKIYLDVSGAMTQLLTDDELLELTGCVRQSEQCKVLDEAEIFYIRRRVDGRPRTTWYNVCHPGLSRDARYDEEPDWAAMER